MATMPQAQAMDIGTATMASTSGMSGGKMQYTQQPQNQVPSVTLTPQLLTLLASSGLLTANQPNQSNTMLQQQQQQPTTQQVQPTVSQSFQSDAGAQQQQQQQANPQIELLKQYLMQQMTLQQQGQNGSNQAASGPLMTGNDPNMQGQNQEMNSLGSLNFDQNILTSILQGESPMLSFESFEGLSGNITDINFDPNVAQFETVGGDASSQQQFDETTTAVQNLNG